MNRGDLSGQGFIRLLQPKENGYRQRHAGSCADYFSMMPVVESICATRVYGFPGSTVISESQSACPASENLMGYEPGRSNITKGARPNCVPLQETKAPGGFEANVTGTVGLGLAAGGGVTGGLAAMTFIGSARTEVFMVVSDGGAAGAGSIFEIFGAGAVVTGMIRGACVWTDVVGAEAAEAGAGGIFCPRADLGSIWIASHESFTALPRLRVDLLKMTSPSRLNTATLFRRARPPFPPS